MNLGGMTISYSTWKKNNRNNEKEKLENDIKALQENFNVTKDEEVNNQLNIAKENLEEIRKYELEGLLLRAKARWVEEGEKPTKYFCHLEKRNYVNKTVAKLILDNGTHVTEQKDILDEIKYFYQNLYKSKDDDMEDVNLDNIFENYYIPKLSIDDKQRLDQDLTKSRGSRCFKEE